VLVMTPTSFKYGIHDFCQLYSSFDDDDDDDNNSVSLIT